MVDVTQHLNWLNENLQGEGNTVLLFKREFNLFIKGLLQRSAILLT